MDAQALLNATRTLRAHGHKTNATKRSSVTVPEAPIWFSSVATQNYCIWMEYIFIQALSWFCWKFLELGLEVKAPYSTKLAG